MAKDKETWLETDITEKENGQQSFYVRFECPICGKKETDRWVYVPKYGNYAEANWIVIEHLITHIMELKEKVEKIKEMLEKQEEI